jgi:hypothetical protein
MTIKMANVTTELSKSTPQEKLAFAVAMRTAYLAQYKGEPTDLEPLRKIDETIRIFKSQL